MDLENYALSLTWAAERLLDLADRDRLSPTYGCFDYHYWRSKSTCFPNARLQEASLTLALLYRQKYPGNRFQGTLEIAELAAAGLRFWASRAHPDGSCDEWYRGEHGFAATAFGAFAASRALRLLGDDAPVSGAVVSALEKAGRWLSARDDLDKLNHEAVAAAALHELSVFLGDDSLAADALRKTELVLACRTPEGWFPELGGFDSGYCFLTLEYLARCWSYTRDEQLRAVLEGTLGFLLNLVAPDLTTGREYNLCGNSYVSLLAAAIMGEFSPAARRLFLEGASRGNTLRQLAQDDLSACYHLYNGLESWDHYERYRGLYTGQEEPLPCVGPPGREYFSQAGILSARGEAWFALAAAHHGGLLKIYSAGEECLLDRGYRVLDSGGEETVSFGLSLAGPAAALPEGLRVEAAFRALAYFFPGRFARALLAFFSALPGGYLPLKKGVDFFRRRKKSSLQLSGISGRPSSRRLVREIILGEEEITVTDRLLGKAPAAVIVEAELRRDGVAVSRPFAAASAEAAKVWRQCGEAVVTKRYPTEDLARARIEVSGGADA